eukprot:scaffold114888_cov37-Prasinocladus_malaysianus.AAC.1
MIVASQSMRGIYQQGGWRAFWAGNGANVLKIAPETATKFFCYDLLKRRICKDPLEPTMTERLAAGGIAGATAQAAIYPLEALYIPPLAFENLNGFVWSMISSNSEEVNMNAIIPCTGNISMVLNVVAQTALLSSTYNQIAKTRLALSSPGAFSGIFQCISSTTASGGLASLYRGFNASLLGII